MTFKGFKDNKGLADRSQYFKRSEGKNISDCCPKAGKNRLTAE